MAFGTEETSVLKTMIEGVTGISFPDPIAAEAGTGLRVDWEAGEARIAAEDIPALCRGIFLLCKALREGKKELHLREERHFATCGAMVDMSRNQVMTVPAVKAWMDRTAALGLNMMMLYTEDTYEIPGYPYFGYLRGRYTRAELREMDDYAAGLGIELIPCIQTLGHLAQMLQWPVFADIKDQPDILLIDQEETYTFLEASLRTVSESFRSRRILIGMDEAHGVGLGNYLTRNGYTDRFELMNRHLKRVCEICAKLGMKPIMWSDMFFRLGSRTNDYYDPDSHVPDRVIEKLPQVEMAYWDYYHDSEAFYESMLREHERMGRGTLYAGGVWTWSGFLPNRALTRETMVPALRVNARRRTDTVIATFWGDDGAETCYPLGIDGLTLFSEACWQGESFDLAECEKMAECLTGVPAEVRGAYEAFYADGCRERTGKAMIWCDPLYPCGISRERKAILRQAAVEALEILKKGGATLANKYTEALYKVLVGKIDLTNTLRDVYLSGDRETLARLTDQDIPALRQRYRELMEAHRNLWESTSRRQGWETLLLRYGGAMERLTDVQREANRYLSGELDMIAELEEKELPQGKGDRYAQVSTPSANLW